MTTYDVQLDRLAKASTAVEGIEADLRQEMANLDRVTAAVLDGGWRGPAAESYRDGWEDWMQGASEVVDGLRSMSRLLGDARAAYVLAENSAVERSWNA
jgi:WXG100 family type VII secretion target